MDRAEVLMILAIAGAVLGAAFAILAAVSDWMTNRKKKPMATMRKRQ